MLTESFNFGVNYLFKHKFVSSILLTLMYITLETLEGAIATLF